MPPLVSTGAMNARLAGIARTVAPGAHAVPVTDRAGWHSAKARTVPDDIRLLHPTPFSPELNPVENARACLRANKPAITVFNTREEIVDAGRNACTFLANDPAAIPSITSRQSAKAR